MTSIEEQKVQLTIKSDSKQAKEDIDSFSKKINTLNKTIKMFKVGAFVKGLQSIGSTISNLVTKQGEYIESVNRFNAVMGEFSSTANDFINQAERVYGLDPQGMQDAFSSFYKLTTGFGVASEEAYKMSQNLTSLSADIMAFSDISLEDAMKKVKSGISGELEPMRALGVALDQATLQETANALGIEKKVNAMTKAQKTELLYYQMMKSTTEIQNELARSTISPSNAIRVLQNEIVRLGRAVGSIFIPMVMKVLPYIRALAEIATEVAQKIAGIFGYKLSDYLSDTSSVGSSLVNTNEEIGDSAEEAGKQMKKMLMPFDELNNVDFNKNSSSGSGVSGVGGSLGLDTIEYDFFAGATDEINAKVKKLKETFEKMLPILVTIGSIFATMFVSTKIASFLMFASNLKNSLLQLGVPAKTVTKLFTSMGSALKVLGGIILIVVGAFEYFKGINSILDESKNYMSGFTTAMIGLGLVVGGVALIFGGIPALITAIIGGIGIAIATAIRYKEEIINFFTNTLPEFGKSVLNWLAELPYNIGVLFGELVGLLVKYFTQTVPNAIKKFFEIKKEIKEKVSNFIRVDIPNFLNEIFIKLLNSIPKIKEIGGNIVSGLWNGIKNATAQFMANIIYFIDGFVAGFKDALGINSPSKLFEEIGNFIIQGLINGIKNMFNSVVNIFVNLKDTIINKFTTISTNIGNITNNLSNIMKNGFSNAKNFVFNVFDNIKNGIIERFENAINFVRNGINRISSFLDFDWELPKIKVPHFSWTSTQATGWIAKTLSALNLPTSLPKLNVSWYENGGFPESGQLFFANENGGAELIGNIGNKTAVANNDQITEGISTATYQAMSRALAENKCGRQNPQIQVYVGNDKLYDGYGKYKSEKENMYGVNL